MRSQWHYCENCLENKCDSYVKQREEAKGINICQSLRHAKKLQVTANSLREGNAKKQFHSDNMGLAANFISSASALTGFFGKSKDEARKKRSIHNIVNYSQFEDQAKIESRILGTVGF